MPPRITRSAGSSPRATARRFERGAIHCRRTVPFVAVEVLTPRTLDEALRLKSEHPDAWPIQGGTDVMVALNFDRGRPETMLNLNEVAELRGLSREDGSLRLGSGLTYAEIEHGRAAEVLPALAEASRTVGSPQIRNRGTIGGNLGTSSPAGDALPPLLVEGAEVECASVRGIAPRAARRVRDRREAQRARRGRADHRRLADAVARAADVHEDRPAERDGDRRRLARRLRRRRAARVVRLGLAAAGARDRAARRGRLVRRARRRRRVADRRRARHRGATVATRCAC